MICTRCREREAQIHLTEIRDASVTSAQLCPPCYAEAFGQSLERVERELRQSSAQFDAVTSRTYGFELRPKRVALKVGETIDFYDISVHAQTRRFGFRRREAIDWSLDASSLDPAVAEWNGQEVVAKAPGRTALSITPDRPDRFGNRPTLPIVIEVLPNEH